AAKYARAAAVAEQRHQMCRLFRPEGEELQSEQGIEELPERRHARHRQLARKSLPGAVVAGKRPRMARGRQPPPVGAAALEDDYRFGRFGRAQQVEEGAAVLDVFEIEADDLRLRILKVELQ